MIKNKILKLITAVGKKSAMMAYNSSSAYCSYQPKEPESLKKLKK